MLAVVIERESWIDLERLSDHTEGEAGDGMSDYQDQWGQTQLIPLILTNQSSLTLLVSIGLRTDAG